ncbi:2-amino-4-hydroxy-6-hydroxymethyldihydropteridine diphosphokinase [Psychrobacter lutiphocae]|uniref:2-amino-4-hydroxy-6- hydroxymethyldihydropteridine diphosphokinase n=1 Tax=Psychrobacter lutiphocae TaxID=540500 RepID=UPI00036DA8F5|nr:2-amino-4-hydroxy-6-hydroxymethyldihydropteridine diphosphokinase [Psychrobacter lutiphocae]
MSHVNTQHIYTKQNSLSRKSTIPAKSKINNTLENNIVKPHFITAICPLAQLRTVNAIGYIVELGSNKNANKHLAQARYQLSKLCQQSTWSDAFVNPDYTATANNPKPDYTNQCGLLKIAVGQIDTEELVQATKAIERQIGHSCNQQVLIDIDVLAVVTTEGVFAVAERYPFKEHEWIGLNELYSKGCYHF